MNAGSPLDQLDRSAICARLKPKRTQRTVAREMPDPIFRDGPPPDRTYAEPRPAAVLIPMFRHLDAWHLLFIRRTVFEGDHHSGQVAFPGGQHERGDASYTATALREAHEEIGLHADQVALLGEMRQMHTVSNFLVTPVVGEIPWPLEVTPDPVEVARVFSIPLAWLGNPDNRRVRVWPSPDHPLARDVVFYDEFDQELLWGVTARITVDFIDCLTRS